MYKKILLLILFSTLITGCNQTLNNSSIQSSNEVETVIEAITNQETIKEDDEDIDTNSSVITNNDEEAVIKSNTTEELVESYSSTEESSTSIKPVYTYTVNPVYWENEPIDLEELIQTELKNYIYIDSKREYGKTITLAAGTHTITAVDTIKNDPNEISLSITVLPLDTTQYCKLTIVSDDHTETSIVSFKDIELTDPCPMLFSKDLGYVMKYYTATYNNEIAVIDRLPNNRRVIPIYMNLFDNTTLQFQPMDNVKIQNNLDALGMTILEGEIADSYYSYIIDTTNNNKYELNYKTNLIALSPNDSRIVITSDHTSKVDVFSYDSNGIQLKKTIDTTLADVTDIEWLDETTFKLLYSTTNSDYTLTLEEVYASKNDVLKIINYDAYLNQNNEYLLYDSYTNPESSIKTAFAEDIKSSISLNVYEIRDGVTVTWYEVTLLDDQKYYTYFPSVTIDGTSNFTIIGNDVTFEIVTIEEFKLSNELEALGYFLQKDANEYIAVNGTSDDIKLLGYPLISRSNKYFVTSSDGNISPSSIAIYNSSMSIEYIFTSSLVKLNATKWISDNHIKLDIDGKEYDMVYQDYWIIKPTSYFMRHSDLVSKCQVNVSELNIRYEASTNSESIGLAAMKTYDILSVFIDSNNMKWYQIGDHMWIAADYAENIE